jgi:hypothetical protein
VQGDHVLRSPAGAVQQAPVLEIAHCAPQLVQLLHLHHEARALTVFAKGTRLRKRSVGICTHCGTTSSKMIYDVTSNLYRSFLVSGGSKDGGRCVGQRGEQ